MTDLWLFLIGASLWVDAAVNVWHQFQASKSTDEYLIVMKQSAESQAQAVEGQKRIAASNEQERQESLKYRQAHDALHVEWQHAFERHVKGPQKS